MTSSDVPVPGPAAGRRRALGRGPGALPAEPVALPEPDLEERVPEATGPEVAIPEGPVPDVTVPEVSAHEATVAEATVPDAAVPQVTAAEVGVPEVSAAEVGVPEVSAVEVGVPEGAAAEVAAAEVGVPEVASPGITAPEPDPVPASSADQPPSDGVFKVRLSNFEGPFDLLLQLISRHKLDVTEVALSRVTDEFMAHIRAMGPDWDLDQTTEFLVVAATLLDLKAARLLPAAEVEDEADLALLEARDLLFARLLQYRAYKQIADIFNARIDDEARRHPRTVGLEPEHAELLPEVVISIGPEGFAELAVKAMQPRPKPQVYVEHIHAPLVSVQEQAGIVVARLKELGEASFRALVEDTDDTLTVVARFLALLELYREKAVALEQETALGDLLVRWTGGDGDAAPVVTDEFDRPPEKPEEDKKP
ncbi:segregation/condensation protein A [Streptomyces sp. NPDC052301]|uniref:segregation and condensation protein A n=1 Tax=Streptomyces sp. NPDC052301 TaxID=3365687 RepID=UPI0037CE1B8D